MILLLHQSRTLKPCLFPYSVRKAVFHPRGKPLDAVSEKAALSCAVRDDR